MDRLKLVVPHWYGSGDNRIADGCRLIADQLPIGDYVVIDDVKGQPITNPKIQNYGLVLDSLQSIKSKLELYRPKEVFTIGGDCGIELPLVSYMASLYGDDMGILWIDSHGDANTPETSPSGTFHGMPVRCLCGEGDEHICATGFSCINPESLGYLGVRDLDQPEAEWIQKNSIPKLNNASEVIKFLSDKKFRKIFVHLDLDAIDPTEFNKVACPTPNGLSVHEITKLLVELREKFHVVGATLTECVAQDKSDLQPIMPILNWWKQQIQ